jgi:hypothetical protein
MARLFDASDIRGVKYGCTEYAVKRLTGRDLYEETGLTSVNMWFENVYLLTGGQCTIRPGTVEDLRAGKLDGTMLRIRPAGQEELHTVILIDGSHGNPVIEDHRSRRVVPAGTLISEWVSAGQRYARCASRRV